MGCTLVAVSGPDGSGKSTLVSKLAHLLELKGHSVKIVSIWDGLIQNKDALKLDPSQIDHYLSVLSVPARTHFFLHAWCQALEIAFEKKTDFLLLDGYWYKYLASEEAKLQDTPSAFHFNPKDEARSLPMPEHFFWVEIPLFVCASRKTKFSGYETNFKGKDQKSFLDFQNKVLPIHRAWLEQLGAKNLNGEHTPEQLVDACIKTICK